METVYEGKTQLEKLAIYTALFGRHEPLYDPLGHLDETYRFDGKGIDRFYFTDLDMSNKRISYPIIKKNLDDLVPRLRIRKTMILIPPEIFDNYEYSIFVGCRVKLAVDPYAFFDYLKPDSDILLLEHNQRDCVYDEGRACVSMGKAKESIMSEQLDFYKEMGYPSNNGLYTTLFILRKHTKEIKKLMNVWWSQLEAFSHRDQVSLPYAIHVCKFNVSTYPKKLNPDLFLQGVVLAPNAASLIQWNWT